MVEAKGFASSEARFNEPIYGFFKKKWRKRKDSNLRDSCEPTRFRVVRLQPLGHASSPILTRFSAKYHTSPKNML